MDLLQFINQIDIGEIYFTLVLSQDFYCCTTPNRINSSQDKVIVNFNKYSGCALRDSLTVHRRVTDLSSRHQFRPVAKEEMSSNRSHPTDCLTETEMTMAEHRSAALAQGKTTLSTPDRDSSPDLPVIGSLIQHESDALDHVATGAVNNCDVEVFMNYADKPNMLGGMSWDLCTEKKKKTTSNFSPTMEETENTEVTETPTQRVQGLSQRVPVCGLACPLCGSAYPGKDQRIQRSRSTGQHSVSYEGTSGD
uniref:Uncharacterized protein n=1 Tax=Timema genevievae TaxID=629358 RepID=A0A7R9PQP1_TIMGE|nr:unnamed protein product [Timema genevievae]